MKYVHCCRYPDKQQTRELASARFQRIDGQIQVLGKFINSVCSVCGRRVYWSTPPYTVGHDRAANEFVFNFKARANQGNSSWSCCAPTCTVQGKVRVQVYWASAAWGVLTPAGVVLLCTHAVKSSIPMHTKTIALCQGYVFDNESVSTLVLLLLL